MSVPSGRDIAMVNAYGLRHPREIQKTQQPLLYPLRSSPFVCIADILEILILFVIVVVLQRKPVTSFASVMHTMRPLEDDIGSHMKRRPFVSLFWFLCTATQFVKIFGFEGRSIWWAKVAAGSYIGSWLLITAVSLLPRDEVSNISFGQGHRDILSLVNVALYYLHAGFSCYAMYQVTHMDDIVGDTLSEEKEISSIRAGVLGLLVCCTSIPAGVIMLGGSVGYFLLFITALGLDEQRSFPLREKAARTIAAILLLGFSPFLIAHFSTICWWVYLIVDIAVQGGALNIFMFFGLCLVNLMCDHLFRNVASLNHMKALKEDELLYWFLAVTLLLVGCLYCAFAYDPEGTVKPAWLDKLA